MTFVFGLNVRTFQGNTVMRKKYDYEDMIIGEMLYQYRRLNISTEEFSTNIRSTRIKLFI